MEGMSMHENKQTSTLSNFCPLQCAAHPWLGALRHSEASKSTTHCSLPQASLPHNHLGALEAACGSPISVASKKQSYLGHSFHARRISSVPGTAATELAA